MTRIRFYSTTHPKSFKSPVLETAIRNLGKLPTELAKIGTAITSEIKRNLSGRILQRRTGALHDSWNWAISAAQKGWDLVIGSDVAYAAIHEFGGWTGKGGRTRIRKTRYVSRAVLKKKTAVRRILRDYTANIWFR